MIGHHFIGLLYTNSVYLSKTHKLGKCSKDMSNSTLSLGFHIPASFAVTLAVFGINSELNSGITVIISTFVMGVFWGFVYKKTNSLRWIILAHLLVDLFNLSAASFLDLYDKGSW